MPDIRIFGNKFSLSNSSPIGLILTIATFVILGIYFILSHPLTTNDTYFHLAVGREVAKTHQIPKTDNFVFGSENTNYLSAEWLSGFVFYLLTDNFGLRSLFILRVICGLATIFFLYKTIKLFSSNYLFINATVLLIGYLLPFRLSTRPEMFTLVFLAFLNYVCLYYFLKKKLAFGTYLLPLIFLLWPNLHGLSPIGFGIFTFYAVVLYLKYKQIKFLIVYIISLLLYLPQYQLIFSFLHANIFSQYITEFTSLWGRVFPSSEFARFYSFITFEIYIYLFFLITFPILLFKAFKSQNKYLKFLSILYLLILIAPLKFFRLIVPSLILVVPFYNYLSRKLVDGIKSPYLIAANSILFIVVIVSIFSGHTFGNTRSVEIFPDQAQKSIKSMLNSKRVFTIYYWNDYLFWNIPTIKTYADVMTQYRTTQDMDDERRLHSADGDASQLIKKYNIDTVVSTRQDAARFIGWSRTPVHKLADWKLIYIDNTAVVYARKDVVKNKAVDLSVINPNLTTSLKFDVKDEEKAIEQLENLLKFNNKNDFAWEQLIFYQFNNKKDLTKAKLLTQDALRALPDDPFFSFILAAIYLEESDCRQATIFAKKSLDTNKDDQKLENSTKTILNRCGLTH